MPTKLKLDENGTRSVRVGNLVSPPRGHMASGGVNGVSKDDIPPENTIFQCEDFARSVEYADAKAVTGASADGKAALIAKMARLLNIE